MYVMYVCAHVCRYVCMYVCMVYVYVLFSCRPIIPIILEDDRNSASVSGSVPKVGKWPLSAEFRFRPKPESKLSVCFRPKLIVTFGHQPKVYFYFRNATLVLCLHVLLSMSGGQSSLSNMIPRPHMYIMCMCVRLCHCV